jgi:sugar lactone lactonase YvrE
MKYSTIIYGLLSGILLLGVYFILLAPPIDAQLFETEEPLALSAAMQPNYKLLKAELLAAGKVFGPEDIDVDSEGRIYAGTQDGKIIRIGKNNQVETFANTGGRPLGLHFDATGKLIVCDAWKGLLSIDKNGKITVLSTQAAGKPFNFTDDLDIDSKGIIYFTDASRFNPTDYMLDALEAKPHGRLLSYNPATKQTKELARDLYFANGVALSREEDFLLINETFRYRIMRYWLKGPKTGQTEIFLDNLPGFPDGISSNRKGIFWLAMPTLRNPLLDALHSKPWLKNFLAKLPKWTLPKPQNYGLVVALDEQGTILGSLHDQSGTHLKEITSAQQVGDYLYLGSLHGDRIGRLKL